ncbi:PBSX family phage terminase large subunit [Acetobacteraceae bacterium ESL0709]|nr:PBSX family phage terminase large subunit [Acetobacteraceae bacterium ESL0697]MDF7678131.1 PBSX family phage terminase large subunit [Acetobacteraceae bacterium ESL0709]
MSRMVDIPTARIFEPLLRKARYKGAYGGRCSGKSHFFAQLLIEECLRRPPLRAVCIREVQKSMRFSVKQLISDYIIRYDLSALFDVQRELIQTPDGGVIIFQGMQDHTAESIKSLEGFDIAWVEEAQTLSDHSLKLLCPTIRKKDSELWFSWNPNRETDPVDRFFRHNRMEHDSDVICVKANYSDNPWFDETMERARLRDRKGNLAEYEWIWEGGYRTSIGAYFKPESFLENGEAVRFPAPVDYVFATLDTSLKGGYGNDGTAICYFAVNKHASSLPGRYPLTVLDWDIVEMEAASLPQWLPTIYEKLQELSFLTKSRELSRPLYIEDKAAGCALLQACRTKGWPSLAIDSKLTSLGKDVRAFNLARYVNKDMIRISDHAWEKTASFCGETTNHLRKQLFDFVMGDTHSHNRHDDLLDCLCYGAALSLGNRQGF